MQTFMTLSGILLTGLMLAGILLPWWKQRRHLVSFWSFFLLGSMVFISMSLVQNAAVLSSGNEFGPEIVSFVTATFIFYGLAAIVYLWPARAPIPKNALQNWPIDSDPAIVAVAITFGIAGPLMPLIPFFPGVQILYVTNAPMSIAAFTLAIIYFVRRPGSFIGYALLAVTFGGGLLSVLTFGGGRRELLALMAALPIVAYWHYFRHRPPGRTLVGVMALASIGVVVITSYATIRHDDRDLTSSASKAVVRIKKLPSAIVENLTSFSFFGGQGAVFDGQNAVWAGMLTIALTEETKVLERDYFATVKFVALNPVPRSLWPGKPEGLGKILPVAMGENIVNWGPSIIGHAFYDGGWPVVFIYGLGLGWIIRRLDTCMLWDPTNPWKIAMFASIIGHVVGFSRGDCGVFGINILGTMVVLYVFILPFKFLLGRRLNPQHAQAAPA